MSNIVYEHMKDEPYRKALQAAIVRYVKATGQSTLRGKAFDVGKKDGRKAYAAWLAGEIVALNQFLVEESK